MFCKLGDIIFELLKSPSSFDREKSYNYPEHETIESKTKLQYTGEGLERISLYIKFHYSFCSPEEEMEKLETAAEDHSPLSLVFGSGVYRGKYVIESFSQSFTDSFPDGEVLCMEVKLELKEWAEDDPIAIINEQNSLQKRKAQALKKYKAFITAQKKSGSQTAQGDYTEVPLETIVRQS